MRAPHFWTEKKWPSHLLLPLAFLYDAAQRYRRRRATPARIGVPVICVGNLVAGGAGKTPVAIALGQLLASRQSGIFFLTKGYGGSLHGPVRVDPTHHTVAQVGDEAILLASALPTVMCKNRVQGVCAAAEAGAKLIIMDDGFQNPTVHKDISLLVVNGRYGFGNERILPAGPLRESVAGGMQRADAVVILGEDRSGVAAHIPAGKKILRAHITPMAGERQLEGKRVLAFAGIARPEKFYATLMQMEAEIVGMVGFPDHHAFKRSALEALMHRAKDQEAILVTTAKDAVRIPEDIRRELVVVEIEAVFTDAGDALDTLLPITS